MSDSFDLELLKQQGVVDFGYTEEDRAISYQKYLDWINQEKAGKLTYLTDERSLKRESLKSIFPEFKSAFVFLFNYPKFEFSKDDLKIASYALSFGSKDYHFVLKDRLKTIAESMTEKEYKISLDVEPVLERDLAHRAGLGWFGKNSMLINKTHGSYFLIGSILFSQTFNQPIKNLETDHCGNCTKCIDFCPTDAISEDRTLDAKKCISTYTIEEFKDVAPPVSYDSVTSEIFGCDICQEVCPWNHKLPTQQLPENFVTAFFLNKSAKKILSKLDKMSNREYKRIFYGTALARTGRIGMIKNLKALIKF